MKRECESEVQKERRLRKSDFCFFSLQEELDQFYITSINDHL